MANVDNGMGVGAAKGAREKLNFRCSQTAFPGHFSGLETVTSLSKYL